MNAQKYYVQNKNEKILPVRAKFLANKIDTFDIS